MSKINILKSEKTIQDYISLGYIYLLMLGIIADTIYYGFLGINIFSYSSVLDVLLSPLVIFTKKLTVPLLLLLSIFIVFGLAHFPPKFHAKYKENDWYKKRFNTEKLDKKYAKEDFRRTLFIISVMIISFYLGIGLGSGSKTANRIKTGDFEPNHKIHFITDKEPQDVYLVGQNSQYLFYATESEKQISITPIQGNIKKIQMIPNTK